MNQITIMGHLGADPEVRFTSSGQKVTTLRIAENQRRGGKDETLWWRITVWGEQFDKMISFLKKGSAVIATGEMPKPEIYNNREGQPQISLNMTAHHLAFSPFGRTDKQGQEQPAFAGQAQQNAQGFENGAASQQQGQGQGFPAKEEEPFSDDEIPF